MLSREKNSVPRATGVSVFIKQHLWYLTLLSMKRQLNQSQVMINQLSLSGAPRADGGLPSVM